MAELTSLARPYAKAAFAYAKDRSAVDAWADFLSLAGQVVADTDFAQFLHNPAIAAATKTKVLMGICVPEAANESPIQQVLDSVRAVGINIDALVAQVGTQNPSQDPHGQSKAWTNFIGQLAQHERLPLLSTIANLFSQLKSAELKQIDAYITSAYPLSDEERQLLQRSLAAQEHAIVILHEAVDSALLGGATIKVGDKFTDGSVRGKLRQLKTQLGA